MSNASFDSIETAREVLFELLRLDAYESLISVLTSRKQYVNHVSSSIASTLAWQFANSISSVLEDGEVLLYFEDFNE